ncbi:39S ribosomal protein L38-like protein [Leptotrombidium deliense]|uniref:Large ribosomal subunit protein mL38 n=1 Tax=Leptotrombidium deliense TaxID=299467 RepID=A0A443SFV2_9ACAR|nr:39S ribosomal protein L38-like protein [Leptotrombidium deliense]
MSKSLTVCQRLNSISKSSRIFAAKCSSTPALDIDSKRGIRYWRQALPFPPNYYFGDGHHVFYPSLKESLNEKKAVENPVKLIDIGLQIEGQEIASKKQRRRIQSTNVESINEENILDLLKTKQESVEFDYKSFSQKLNSSNEGQKEIVNLAHHYGIFRDLFTSPSQTPVNSKLPAIKPFDFFPRSEEEMLKITGDWYPGAKRVKYPDPKPIYYFSPVAPVYAEFTIAENEIVDDDDEAIARLRDDYVESPKSEDNLEVSVVYRGNIIRPQFARYRPNVVIDTRRLCGEINEETENTVINVDQAGIQIIGDKNNYYTLMLLNLDSQFGDEKPVCHWQVANIKYDSESQKSKGEESISYLPVYGIRGLGYHRYVFLVCRHEKPVHLPKVDDFELKKRLFDPLAFVQQHNATPVGLSWFQTTYDYWCHNLFHNVLNMRVPTYEWIQPKGKLQKQIQYPEKVGFNIYLDHYRDPKEINKQVLLERLKSVHPFEYDKEIEPRKLPANIYKYPDNRMSWQRSIFWKKANRTGEYRNLRPASALKPLNNNEDLDKPLWPPKQSASIPLRWPCFKRVTTPLSESRWALPPQEHPEQQIFGEDIRESRENEEKEQREARKHIN